jgi:hypothetical protein
MAFRITFVSFLLSSIVSLAIAQAADSAPADDKPQPRLSQDAKVAVEMRFLIFTDESVHHFPAPWNLRLPEMSSCAVYDKQQTERLMKMANGYPIASVGTLRTITLHNGEHGEFAAIGPKDSAQGDDTLQASVSDDRQAIQLQLRWAKWRNGKERLPTMNATVPCGAHLAVHACDLLDSKRVEAATWTEQLAWWLLPDQKPKPKPDRWYGILLLTPKIVSHAEETTQTALR